MHASQCTFCCADGFLSFFFQSYTESYFFAFFFKFFVNKEHNAGVTLAMQEVKNTTKTYVDNTENKSSNYLNNNS